MTAVLIRGFAARHVPVCPYPCPRRIAGFCRRLPGRAAGKPPAISKGDYHAVVSYLSKRISHDLSALDVPGLSIALVDDQKLVWSAGFGYADEARHRSASSDTLYRVGAISKLVTAAGVMRAADDGRLALDMPARAGAAAVGDPAAPRPCNGWVRIRSPRAAY